MELCRIIDELRKGQLSASLIKNHPKWVSLCRVNTFEILRIKKILYILYVTFVNNALLHTIVQAHIICQLVQEDPNKRPSTDELLQSVTEDKDVLIARLKEDIVKKDNTIREMKDKIAMLQARITEFEPLSENR